MKTHRVQCNLVARKGLRAQSYGKENSAKREKTILGMGLVNSIKKKKNYGSVIAESVTLHKGRIYFLKVSQKTCTKRISKKA